MDYEKRSKFDIVAVKVEESGETIDILVEVDDENDNAPSFADQVVKVSITLFAGEISQSCQLTICLKNNLKQIVS